MDASIEEEPAKWRPSRKLPFRQISFGLEQLIENGIAHHMKQLEDALEELKSSNGGAPLQTSRDNVRQVLTLLTRDLREIEEMKQHVKDENLVQFGSIADPTCREVHRAVQKAKPVVTADACRDSSATPNVSENVYLNTKIPVANDAGAIEESMLIEENEELYREAQDMETIAEDMRDLKKMMGLLSQHVFDQGEAVEAIEHHVENVAVNVTSAEILLAQARRLKTVALPLVGMTVGFAAGGPIGAVAGARIGIVTSMAGGVIGYAGGKVFQKINNFIPRV